MNPTNPNDWKELLRAAHNDPIDAAHYTAVRARVTAEIEKTRSPWRRLAWISGVTSGVGAIAAALVFAIALHRADVAPPPPPRVVIAMPVPPPAPPAVRKPRPVHVAHAKPAPQPHREPLTIKLQTSDPNIVIYWIAD